MANPLSLTITKCPQTQLATNYYFHPVNKISWSEDKINDCSCYSENLTDKSGVKKYTSGLRVGCENKTLYTSGLYFKIPAKSCTQKNAYVYLTFSIKALTAIPAGTKYKLWFTAQKNPKYFLDYTQSDQHFTITIPENIAKNATATLHFKTSLTQLNLNQENERSFSICGTTNSNCLFSIDLSKSKVVYSLTSISSIKIEDINVTSSFTSTQTLSFNFRIDGSSDATISKVEGGFSNYTNLTSQVKLASNKKFGNGSVNISSAGSYHIKITNSFGEELIQTIDFSKLILETPNSIKHVILKKGSEYTIPHSSAFPSLASKGLDSYGWIERSKLKANNNKIVQIKINQEETDFDTIGDLSAKILLKNSKFTINNNTDLVAVYIGGYNIRLRHEQTILATFERDVYYTRYGLSNSIFNFSGFDESVILNNIESGQYFVGFSNNTLYPNKIFKQNHIYELDALNSQTTNFDTCVTSIQPAIKSNSISDNKSDRQDVSVVIRNLYNDQRTVSYGFFTQEPADSAVLQNQIILSANEEKTIVYNVSNPCHLYFKIDGGEINGVQNVQTLDLGEFFFISLVTNNSEINDCSAEKINGFRKILISNSLSNFILPKNVVYQEKWKFDGWIFGSSDYGTSFSGIGVNQPSYSFKVSDLYTNRNLYLYPIFSKKYRINFINGIDCALSDYATESIMQYSYCNDIKEINIPIKTPIIKSELCYNTLGWAFDRNSQIKNYDENTDIFISDESKFDEYNETILYSVYQPIVYNIAVPIQQGIGETSLLRAVYYKYKVGLYHDMDCTRPVDRLNPLILTKNNFKFDGFNFVCEQGFISEKIIDSDGIYRENIDEGVPNPLSNIILSIVSNGIPSTNNFFLEAIWTARIYKIRLIAGIGNEILLKRTLYEEFGNKIYLNEFNPDPLTSLPNNEDFILNRAGYKFTGYFLNDEKFINENGRFISDYLKQANYPGDLELTAHYQALSSCKIYVDGVWKPVLIHQFNEYKDKWELIRSKQKDDREFKETN